MKKDVQEFQEIYDTYQPRILSYLARMVGPDEAEDLTQDVFLKVIQALPGFRGQSSLSTWIYRIATNAAWDRLRRPAGQRTAASGPREDADAGADAEDALMGEAAPSAEQQLIRVEMRGCIMEFVEKLPENYRTVIVLSELEDLRNSEIAEILGVTLDTVKIRLHRARARLKEELRGHCDFFRDERNEIACDRKREDPKPALTD